MAQGFVDRLLTIVVTATLSSAAWIVAGSVYFDRTASSEQGPGKISDAVAERSQVRAAIAPGSPADSNVASSDGAQLAIPVLNVKAAQLRDTFSDERGGGARRHEALDILAPSGTPVVAAAAGTVEKLFHSEAGGNTVYIRSPDQRTIHYYAHLHAYAPGLKEGQKIARGQRLGSVGSSGNADPAAPHLHFAVLRTLADAEWWEPATAVNPYPLLRGT